MPTKAKKKTGKVLTAAKAAQIRKLGAAGKLSQREIAAKVGCSRTTVADVISGKTWKN